MAGLHRLFIGMQLPPAVAGAVAQWQGQLAAHTARVRWEPRDRLHLTLRFLGNTDPELESTIGERLAGVAAQAPTLGLRLAAAGGFPTLRRARVLWLGVEGDLEPLQRLRAALDAELTGLGIDPDPGPFHPHVTIGRLRPTMGSLDRRRLLDRAERVPPPSGGWTVRQVTLFRSVQEHGATRHVELASAPLGGTTPSRTP